MTFVLILFLYMKKFYSLTLLTLLLSGCNNALTLEFVKYQYIESPLQTYVEEKGDIYYRDDHITTLVVEEIEDVNIKTKVYEFKELNDVTRAFEDKSYSLRSNDVNNPNGSIIQNLLVVPVYFTDSSVASNASLKEEKKILLENAFFGDEKYTTYQSVASYYNRSSYGHLKLQGEVLDWMSIDQTSTEAYNEGKSSPENYSDKIAEMIVNNLDSDTFNKYSTNKSGVLDALYIIYDHPYQTDKKNNQDSLFWAYTYHCKSTPKVSSYSWSSFNFVGEKSLLTHRVDATTYIHEVGHLFGLLDYYNKGVYSPYYQPLGFMDMMDYNLGDHSPFSKYTLNWASPKVLDMGERSSGEITIKDFSSTGDFILVPNKNYNGTPYDRYLLISFFTPKGLNNLKEFPSYEFIDKNGNRGIFTYPNQYGVLVYEVNAKLGYYKSTTIRSQKAECFVDENPGVGDYVISFRYDNELTDNKDLPVYHLLERSGENSFFEGKSASNHTLFKFGDNFGIDTFKELSNEFGINFKISKLTTKEAKISFFKN